MEEIFKQVTFYLAAGVEAAAAIVIGFAVIEATIGAFKLFFIRRSMPEEAKEAIRLRLGRWLAIALEFELAADILRTAIAPTWNEIGQLAAIVVLRTALNYFLQKEIDKAEARRGGKLERSGPPGASGWRDWDAGIHRAMDRRRRALHRNG